MATILRLDIGNAHPEPQGVRAQRICSPHFAAAATMRGSVFLE
jgi:hypothetical protein